MPGLSSDAIGIRDCAFTHAFVPTAKVAIFSLQSAIHPSLCEFYISVMY